jgi:hypothetical protein
MVILSAILLVCQAPCIEDCPSRKSHVESVTHTQGGACDTCKKPTDVCFKLCLECAADRKRCVGCGASERAPEKSWRQEGGAIAKAENLLVSTAEEWAALWTRNGGAADALPKIDFTQSVVVAIFRGSVVQSERGVLQGVREFEDRVVVTYSTRTPQCGSEPRSVEALFVRLPRIAGKKWIVERVRHSFLPVPSRTERVELTAPK